MTYAQVAGLPLVIDRCELLPIVRDTSSGFTKVSIVVRLSGGSHVGEGEDITWDQIDQIEFLRAGADLTWLHGSRTFDELSTLLGLANLFPVAPIRDSAPYYRRWAVESAALDLALRQNGLSLQAAVGREAEPVNFVASVRTGEPPSLTPIRARLAVDPGLRFKLDPTPDWDDGLVAELARLDCVAVIDLKGSYRNATVAMDADPGLYHRVIAQTPVQKLQSYFGQSVQFPLDRSLTVKRGQVVALTVPSWAPALTQSVDDGSSWRASRPKGKCDDTDSQTAQADTGDRTQYRCLYRARLTYSATLITDPRPNKP